MATDITGASVFCLRQESALIFLCVLIRHNLGAFIAAVIFKDDILALPSCTVVWTLIISKWLFSQTQQLNERPAPNLREII